MNVAMPANRTQTHTQAQRKIYLLALAHNSENNQTFNYDCFNLCSFSSMCFIGSGLAVPRFKMTFMLNSELPDGNGVDLREVLERCLGCLSARNHQEMTFVS